MHTKLACNGEELQNTNDKAISSSGLLIVKSQRTEMLLEVSKHVKQAICTSYIIINFRIV